MADDDRVFKALADPTRRRLLDLLRERDGRSQSELEQGLDMTRFGVAKHLAVLEDAGLVVVVRAGRRKLHHLNAVPVREVHDRWTSAYTGRRDSALLTLRDHLEDGMSTTTDVRHVERIFIKAAPQAIWDAIVKPEWTVQYFYGTRVEADLAPGVSYRALGLAGQGDEVMVDGEVVEADPPHRLVHTWRALWDDALRDEGARQVLWEVVQVRPGVCSLTVTHDLTDAPATAEQVTGRTPGAGGGWTEVLSGLKTLLETGQALP